MVIAFLFGFIFGFLGSMPLAGPVALLVFGRGLDNKFRSGFHIAFGAALAESAYAFLAFWGLSTLVQEHAFIVPVSRAVGAIILLALGIYFARRKTQETGETRSRMRSGHSFLLGFTISAFNPTLLATWTAAVTMAYSTGVLVFSQSQALPFSVGVCLGSVGWFALLLFLLYRYKSRFRRSTLDRILQGTGVMLIGLGLWFAWHFVSYFLHPAGAGMPV